MPVDGHFRNGGVMRELYPLVPYRLTLRSAHDNSRGSGFLTCHRPIASRMLDVDEECCQIGRIGKTCDLATHRTDQKALRLLGRLIDIEHGIVTKGLVNGRAGHAGIAGHTMVSLDPQPALRID